MSNRLGEDITRSLVLGAPSGLSLRLAVPGSSWFHLFLTAQNATLYFLLIGTAGTIWNLEPLRVRAGNHCLPPKHRSEVLCSTKSAGGCAR